MGLLNPLLLAVGLAAAVPLLLHMLQRHQGPRFVFPALRYLRRAEKESARRIRVRQILLMLLRVAAVLLVALAAARPFLPAGGVGHAPTAAVIVLDNSLSSGVVEGDVRLVDAFRERALEVLEAGGPDDRFWLLRAGSPGEPALGGDAVQTALRVRETEPTAAAADLAAALLHARALLAAGAEGRAAEIHLLSDLQATSLPAPVPADDTAPPVVVWHPGTAPPPNRAVSEVIVGGGLAPVAGTGSSVAAAISGDGTDPVSVRLIIDDVLLAAAAAPPGAAAVLTLPPQPPGFVAGRVEIDRDALHIDDSRHFVARVVPPPAVGVAGELPFVTDALDVLADAGRIRRTGTGAADVAIHAGGEGLGLSSARAVVVLPPDAPELLAAANSRLAAAGIPWRYGSTTAGEARFAAAEADPLLRVLQETRLRVVYPLVPEGAGPTDSVMLRLTDGTAWAARGQRLTGGTYVVLATPLSPEASTLPVSAAMLPLLDRLTGSWAAAQPVRTEFLPGETVIVAPGVDTMVRPEGSRDAVTAGTEYRLGDQPGIYRALAADSVVGGYAVNAPAVASDLRRLDRLSLQQRLPGWPLHVTSDAAAWQRNVFRARLGRELWRLLLVVAFVTLCVESVVAAAGPARSTVAAPSAISATGTETG
jgi:hypothetical protein